MSKDDFFPPEPTTTKKGKTPPKTEGEKGKKIHIPKPKKSREVFTKKYDGQKTAVGSPSKRIKAAWVKAGKPTSLKKFARGNEGDDWLHNKSVTRILRKKGSTGAKVNINTLRDEIFEVIEQRKKG